MNIAKFFRRFEKSIKSIIIISKLWGVRKAIKVLIFNIILNAHPPPFKEEIVMTKMRTKMHIIPYDRGISRELKIFKIHEPLTTKIIIDELKRKRILGAKVIVADIGSNIGYYAILEAKLLDRNSILICIEPIRRTFQYLLKNLKNNMVNMKYVKTFNVALSDRIGSARMITCHGSNWARILEKNHTESSFEVVAVTTGDQLFQSFDKIDLMRMDVEGHEYQVIKGSFNVIKQHLPDLLIEIHPVMLGKHKLLELLCLLRNLGYKVKYFIPRYVDVPLAADDNDVMVVDINRLILCPPEWNFTLYLEHPLKSNK
ncbi:MAG: FkbM family methyltransferase [Thermoproteota archaeon]